MLIKLNYTNLIETNVRSINHHSFALNTVSNIVFEVFVAYFQASRGLDNENKRLFEVKNLNFTHIHT